MEIHLKLYGSSKMLSDKEILHIKLPNNSNVEKLRITLSKIISKKFLHHIKLLIYVLFCLLFQFL